MSHELELELKSIVTRRQDVHHRATFHNNATMASTDSWLG